ncbi:efflux RND transporter periplasmic adaptor subunit, partial [Ilyobacter sp.]|uniref:efflux RND transporter periplasmic adaptor subunit n=1 Tax=Ilyobacter sp. TaxID=3100343 RepID=UPI003563673C
NVPLFRASWIEKGEQAVVTLSDSKTQKTYEGVVERVSQGAKIVESENFQDKVIEVYISLKNTDGLKLGYYTSVNIKGKKVDDSLTVNSFSVLEEDGGHYVYTLEDGAAKKTPVDIGKKVSSRIEILNLPEGTPIIVNPFKVRDGEKISIEK